MFRQRLRPFFKALPLERAGSHKSRRYNAIFATYGIIVETTKIAGAIVLASIIIGCGIYFGPTQERREYMRICLSSNSTANPDYAELLCATQFAYKR